MRVSELPINTFCSTQTLPKHSKRQPLQQLDCTETMDTTDDAKPSWQCSDLNSLEMLLSREAEFKADPEAFTSKQPELNMIMRAILVDWMMEVSMEFMLKRETLHMAVCLMDRFTSIDLVRRNEFQLAGLCCLFIACKFEEIYVPKMNDFAQAADHAFTTDEMRAMERRIFQKFTWRIMPATLFHYTSWLMTQWDDFIMHMQPGWVLYFKQPLEASYKLYREAMHIIDTITMDACHIQLNKLLLVAGVLYAVLFRNASNQEQFYILFEEFLQKCLEMERLECIVPVLHYIKEFLVLEISYELPRACRVLPREKLSSHYEDFLCFQTYSKSSLTYLRLKLQ